MRRIVKRKPGPTKLVELHRQGKRFANLDDDPHDKRVVRDALLHDQGFLCCYCMRRIEPGKHQVRIEHHQSQSTAPERDLDWDNLLAACSGARKLRGRAKDDAGARKVPRSEQTCDNRKGDEVITINPLDASVDAIRYLNDGRIQHSIEQLQADIDERLNLNVDFLVEDRLAAREELIERLRRELGPDKTWTPATLQRYLGARRQGTSLPRYFGYIEALLTRWIAKRKR